MSSVQSESMSGTFEKGALVVLSVMLVSVFVLSIHMYDTISQGTADGALAVFAENARNFVYENEAVAAFLGIEESEAYEYANIDIEAEVAAYIERYNDAFKDAE